MPSMKNYNAVIQEIKDFKNRVIQLDTEAKPNPIHFFKSKELGLKQCNCHIPHKSMNYFHLADGRVWWVDSILHDKIVSIAKDLKDDNRS